MNKISIIIPNYNNEKYIEQCIRSVLNQTYNNYEIIIVDDGSNDRSVEIIETLSKKDERIKLMKQYNQNASIARNRGIEAAKGEYMLFMDGDDYLYEKRTLEIIISKIGSKDILIGNYAIADEENNVTGEYRTEDDITKNTKDILEKYAFVSPVPTNKLYRSSIIKNNGLFFDNVDIGQDLNFYLKYLGVCKSATTINTKIYNYRINSQGMTKSVNYSMFDIIKNIECIKNYYKTNNIKNSDIINAIAFIHYCAQMDKLKNFNKRSERVLIYRFFTHFINNLTLEKKYNNHKYIRAKKVYRIKRLFKYIYLSKWYRRSN